MEYSWSQNEEKNSKSQSCATLTILTFYWSKPLEGLKMNFLISIPKAINAIKLWKCFLKGLYNVRDQIGACCWFTRTTRVGQKPPSHIAMMHNLLEDIIFCGIIHVTNAQIPSLVW
jgi:hypothetical protein